MKSILFVREASEEFGGIETQVCRIAREVAARRLFFPVLLTSDAASLLARRFEGMGFPVFAIPMEGRELADGIRGAGRIMKEFNVSLIQSHMFRESFIGRALRFLHPRVRHVYRVHTYIDCSRIAPWKKEAYHAADRAGQRWVDRYACISGDARRELLERSRISPDKIRVIANASDVLGPPDPPAARSAAPLPRRIAMVANFVPGKGHEVLLRALALLKGKSILLRARLIGGERTNGASSSSFTGALKHKADALGVLEQLEFYGYTQQVATALSGIPVVVLPSDSEGIPNCLLEAMSLRKIVVASRVGGIPEIIDDGVHGLLHPPQNAEGLTAILAGIFSTPALGWDAVRDNAYRRWREKFSVETMMDGLAGVYHELGAVT